MLTSDFSLAYITALMSIYRSCICYGIVIGRNHRTSCKGEMCAYTWEKNEDDNNEVNEKAVDDITKTTRELFREK